MTKKEVFAKIMSTKSKKLYSSIDIEDAKRVREKVLNIYSRKSQRRRTVQIRVSRDWYARLKELAKEEDLVLSVLADKMCELFFKNFADSTKIKGKSRKNYEL